MKKSLTKSLHFLAGIALAFMVGSAYAQSGPTTVSALISAIQNNLLIPILNIVVSISYLAGAGFIVAAIFKFKAHKDNPTQVTVGTPVMLLFVGVGLLFFPALVSEIMTSIGFSTSSGGNLTYAGGGSLSG